MSRNKNKSGKKTRLTTGRTRKRMDSSEKSNNSKKGTTLEKTS